MSWISDECRNLSQFFHESPATITGEPVDVIFSTNAIGGREQADRDSEGLCGGRGGDFAPSVHGGGSLMPGCKGILDCNYHI
jgi:hypothetical protein